MTTQFCVHCGARLGLAARFCRACGAPVEHTTPQSASSPHSKGESSDSHRSIPVIVWVLASAAVLLVAGFLVLFDANRPAPTTDYAAALPDSHDEQGIPYPEVPRISLAEAKARFEAGTVLIVDVRSEDEYIAAHIPNAISLPLADLSTSSRQALETRYRDLTQDAEIITYCT